MDTTPDTQPGKEQADLLMLHGVVAHCADCGDAGLFVPVDDAGFEHCCTRCDAAVLLVEVVDQVVAPALSA